MATIRKATAGSIVDGVEALGSIFRIAGKAANAMEVSVENWAASRIAQSDANRLISDEVRDHETIAEITERTKEAAKRCAGIEQSEMARIRALIAERRANRT